MINYRNIAGLSPRRTCLLIFFIALAVRIAAVILFPMEPLEYEMLANNVLSGKGFVCPYFGGVLYKSFCEPLYPFLCIMVYFLTGHSFFLLALIQAIISTVIVAIIFFCAKMLYRQSIALMAALLVALHPALIIYTTKQHPLVLDSMFICLVLFVMLKLFNNLTWRNIIFAGLISGLCILTRPTIIVFLPLALLYIFMVKKTSIRKSIIYSIVFMIMAGVIFFPWTLRNYLVQGKFMLTRSNTPFVFWLGNNPNFTGSALDSKGDPLPESMPKDFLEKINNLDEISQNEEFLKEAINYIKERPIGFINRTIKKFYYFWWFTPQAGMFYPKSYFLLYKIYYVFALIGTAMGIFFTYKEGLFNAKSGILLIALILLSISLTQSLFYVEARHRWAIEPIFLILTAKGYSDLFQKYIDRAKIKNGKSIIY